MSQTGVFNPAQPIEQLGVKNLGNVFYNLSPETLVQHALDKEQGVLADNGALVIKTGEFTGRSPKDRFVVKSDYTENVVDWGDVNIPFDAEKFDALYEKIMNHMAGKDVYVRDVRACAKSSEGLNVRVVTEYPWQSIFAKNMFLRLEEEEIKSFSPEWHVISFPSYLADAAEDGTRQHNFAVINFDKKTILIGGTAYTGEIKKGIFSVLNCVLPHEKGILPMHCSVNEGANGDAAVFFGLSGTGKTTLSADPQRALIGDDEHGWAEDCVFNFEGGCYAKTINLSEEGEPQIFKAIKSGALLENIKFYDGTNKVDYEDSTITENTRVSYPIHHIDNAKSPSVGNVPKNIFFLTCDAFGVLPPLSKLTPGQAMYHFISGYTAKVAGTEAGITEPKTTFSACFGSPFLPLHPTKYAEMLGEKMKSTNVNVWLVNTGWSGGAYGTGSRMKLKYTRAMVTAALNGELDNVAFETQPVFGLSVPTSCPNVPNEILMPRNTWADKTAYDAKLTELAEAFVKNFVKYADKANKEILEAAPSIEVGA